MNKLIFVAFIFIASSVYADSRYCGEPRRYDNGRIVRSSAVIAEFKRQYPLPSHLNKDEFQINHVIPLSCGGCAEDYCQDRHERITMCPKK